MGGLTENSLANPLDAIRDPLFRQDVGRNVVSALRGGKNILPMTLGAAGDLAYMGASPFINLAGGNLRPEDSFLTTEYLSKQPWMRAYLGPEEDNISYQAGKYLSPVGLLKAPDAVDAALAAGQYAMGNANRVSDALRGGADTVRNIAGNVLDGELLVGSPLSQRGSIGRDINAPRFQFGEPDEMGFRLVSEDVVSMPSFPRKGTAEQMRAALGQGRKGGLSSQVSAEIGGRRLAREELENLGVMRFLDQQEAADQPVTQEDLLAVIQGNKYKYELEERVLGEEPDYEGEFAGRYETTEVDYDDAYNEGYINDETIDYYVETEMEDIESDAKKLGELNDRIASLETQQAPREAGQLDLLSGDSGHVQRYETQQLKEAKVQKDAILRDYKARFPDSPMLSKAEILTRMEDREDYDAADAINIEDELRDWAETQARVEYDDDPLQRVTLNDRDGDEVAYAIGNDERGFDIVSDNTHRATVDTYGHNPTIESQLAEHAMNQGIDDGLYEPTAKYRKYLAEDDQINIIEMGEISAPEEYREIPIYMPGQRAAISVGDHYEAFREGRKMGSPYHIRVTERTWRKPNGEKERILFADELQSDWAQAGSGRKDWPAAKVNQDKAEMLELMRQMDDYDRGPSATKPRYRLEKSDPIWTDPKETDKVFKLAAQKWDKPEVKAAQEKISSMATELSRRLEEAGIVSSTWERNVFNNDLSSPVRDAPLVEGEWVQHSVKRAISEMINNNKDRLVFTSGINQTELYNDTVRAKGLTQFYDKTLKNTVKQVMKNVDKDAVEILEAEAGGEESVKHISIKNTEKLRDFLSGKGGGPKGWGMYGVALPAPIAASFMSGQQEKQQNSPLSP